MELQDFIKPIEKTVFADLDLSFNIHPVKKDLMLSTNTSAIKRALKNLILTNHYERLFHPEIGSNVTKLLFEPMSPTVANYIETEIYNTIVNFEPRVKLQNIEVEGDDDYNGYVITISYYEANSTTPTVIDFLLERLR